jgi:hypothetical protein
MYLKMRMPSHIEIYILSIPSVIQLNFNLSLLIHASNLLILDPAAKYRATHIHILVTVKRTVVMLQLAFDGGLARRS